MGKEQFVSTSITKDEFRWLIAPILEHFNMPHSALDAVVEAYAEHWRVYHGMRHIAGMLKGVRQMEIDKQLDRESLRRLELLIVYHDIWLKIGRTERGESERMSAAWCLRDLNHYKPKAWPHLTGLVTEGITATIDHTLANVSRSNRKLVSFLLDLDLYGLGQRRVQFREDTEAIWLEYQPISTREEFNNGRAQWAWEFLKREQIYHTAAFKRFQRQARANLRALVAAA